MPGETVSHYEILEELGGGGMGVVYRGRDLKLGRDVALKFLPAEISARAVNKERFAREARAASALDHPNICTIYEIDETPDGRLFLAMAYYGGEDLRRRLERGRLELGEALRVALDVTRGLAAAHAAGIVHRDIKPANVMLTERSGVKILDFGLAKLEGESRHLTRSGTTLGTVAYMSPEQARGDEVDTRTDLWSLGVVLYEALSGQLPFRGERDHSLIYAILNHEPEPMAPMRPELPRGVVRLIERLLEKDPQHRVQSAAELAGILEVLLRGESLPKTETALPRTISRTLQRRRRPALLWAGAATALAALAVALGYGLWRRSPPPPARVFHNVAVLPFENLTADPAHDYLSDGLASVVVERLSALPGLNVVGRSETSGYRGRGKSAKQIAQELGVGAVVEGQILQVGNVLRVTADLVDGESGYVFWSRGFETPPHDVLRVAERLAPEIGDALGTRLSDEERARLAARPTQSAEAYEAYVKGLRIFDQLDNPQRLDLARDLLARAVELDAGFAPARAAYAEVLASLYTNRSPDAALLAAAEREAQAALASDPNLLAGRLAMARVYRLTRKYEPALVALRGVVADHPKSDAATLELALAYQESGDLARAETALRQAISLRPDYWKHWLALGNLLMRTGDLAAARKAWEAAAAFAPPEIGWPLENLGALASAEGDFAAALSYFDRLPRPINDAALATNIGAAYFYADRLEEAEEHLRLAVRLQPDNPLFHANLGDLLARRDQDQAARLEYLDAARLGEAELAARTAASSDERLVCAAFQARVGRCKEALATAREAGPQAEPTADNAHTMAEIYAACGERLPALAELTRAVERGYAPARLVREPTFAPLVGEPEWARLVAGAQLSGS
jgi:serine/threonine protein kinase/Flp pilus assembly protein TadD